MAKAFRRCQGAWEVTTSEVSLMRCVEFSNFEEDRGQRKEDTPKMATRDPGWLACHVCSTDFS